MTINVAANVGSGTYVETLTVIDTYSATSFVVISLTVKDPISITGGSLNITKTYGDLYQQSYFINNLTSAVGFRTTTGSTTDACVPVVGTVDSSTYEMLTSIGTCYWIAPSAVSTVDYVVVGGGGSGGISRGGGGGGGGVAIGTGMTVTAGASHEIFIGAGGRGQTNGKANSGANTYVLNSANTQFLASAAGGGGGGSMSTDSNISNGISSGTPPSAVGVSAGGSGGGGAPNFWNGSFYYTEGGAAGTGGSVSGYKGGNSYRCDSSATKNDGSVSGSGRTTGGGGGAGGEGVGYVSGQNCPTYNVNGKPNGGIGVTTTITGQTLYLGGGGGGSDGRSAGGAEYSYSSTGRGVGAYGGGDGEQVYVPGGISAQTPDTLTALAATSGAPNTGGGGGGGINAAGAGSTSHLLVSPMRFH